MTTPDTDLWPIPDPTMGDGSSFGESTVNDGRPGAAGDGSDLLTAFLDHGWTADHPGPTAPLRERLSALLTTVRTDEHGYLVIPSPFYSARGGKTPRIGVFHTAEGARTVQALGAWFQQANADVSSHAGADDTNLARFVPDAYSAWAARSANPVAVQLEMCAFTAWDAAEWAKHPGLLENAARWAADTHLTHGIPLVRLTPAQSVTGTGFVMHVDITDGWHDGTHTDCGADFPIDAVLARARELVLGDDPLSKLTDAEQAELLANTRELLGQMGKNLKTGVYDALVQLGHLSLVDALAETHNAAKATQAYVESEAFRTAVAKSLLAQTVTARTWNGGAIQSAPASVEQMLTRSSEGSVAAHIALGDKVVSVDGKAFAAALGASLTSEAVQQAVAQALASGIVTVNVEVAGRTGA